MSRAPAVVHPARRSDRAEMGAIPLSQANRLEPASLAQRQFGQAGTGIVVRNTSSVHRKTDRPCKLSEAGFLCLVLSHKESDQISSPAQKERGSQ